MSSASTRCEGRHGRPIRVLCVDDHPIVLAGMQAIIDAQCDMEVVAQTDQASAAVNLYKTLRPDVTLMDLNLPHMSGISAIQAIRREDATARILVVTIYSGDEQVRIAAEAGAKGYLLKESLRTEMLDAIRAVHRGQTCFPIEPQSVASDGSRETLTTREFEVLSQIVRGLDNQTIADTLYISKETVKVHVKSILAKLSAKDRLQAILIAHRRGITYID